MGRGGEARKERGEGRGGGWEGGEGSVCEVSCSIVLKCLFGSRSVIDSAHNMDADGEVLPDAVAPESPGPEVEAAKRGRGRPRKSVSSSNLGDSEKEGIPKKAKAKASSAKEGKSGKVQCMAVAN